MTKSIITCIYRVSYKMSFVCKFTIALLQAYIMVLTCSYFRVITTRYFDQERQLNHLVNKLIAHVERQKFIIKDNSFSSKLLKTDADVKCFTGVYIVSFYFFLYLPTLKHNILADVEELVKGTDCGYLDIVHILW